MSKSKKLSIKNKVDIVLSREKSLRRIAAEYGVHHCSVDDIFKESGEILRRYWNEKSERKGRPPKAKDMKGEESIKTEAEKKELSRQVALKQMRIDWLELQLKWEHERAQEEGRQKPKHFKKKKK